MQGVGFRRPDEKLGSLRSEGINLFLEEGMRGVQGVRFRWPEAVAGSGMGVEEPGSSSSRFLGFLALPI